MQIPSLKEYIMISSTAVNIHISRKQNDTSWKFEEITDPASSLFINTIEQNIPVNDTYYEVRF